MSTITGTCHFVSLQKAIDYYSEYHFPDTKQAVEGKIKSGEIRIGKPELKEGESLCVIDAGTRYAITSKD